MALAQWGQCHELPDQQVLDHPTIADVAVYSYLVAAPEGNVDLSGYPSVLRLLQGIEALPGFVPFPRTAAGLRAAQA